MTGGFIWATMAGLSLGSGLLLTVFALPGLNRPQLTERLTPYVHSTDAAVQPARGPALRGVAQIFTPALNVVLKQLDRFSMDSEQLRRRLAEAGLKHSVTDYRIQQLACAAGGAAVSILVVIAAAAAGRSHWFFAVTMVAAGTVLGVGLRDQALSSRIRRRRTRMIAEFPTIAEMLALTVSAGDTAPGAFDRISRTVRGELAAELSDLMSRTKSGEPFTAALRSLATRTGVPQIGRFLEGTAVAVERGTPLAEVMRAQAADVRELSKRDLMETAGRREIGMLVPVVFGILPTTVVFALFPGLSLLSIGL